MARMKILVDDAFPLQLGILEVEQQCQLKTGDIQVTQHLCLMCVVERRHNLRVGDYQFIHDQIGIQRADMLAIVVPICWPS